MIFFQVRTGIKTKKHLTVKFFLTKNYKVFGLFIGKIRICMLNLSIIAYHCSF